MSSQGAWELWARGEDGEAGFVNAYKDKGEAQRFAKRLKRSHPYVHYYLKRRKVAARNVFSSRARRRWKHPADRDESIKYMVVWQGGSSRSFSSRASAISEARLISVESGEEVAVVERKGYHVREVSRIRGGRVVAGVGKGSRDRRRSKRRS